MNERDSNDLKRGAGYLKEKAIIGLTRVTGDELDRAILKVTSHMLKAPKEKHMQRLLAATHGHYKSDTRAGKRICEYIISELEKRIHTHNWVVVLKALVTIHRLMSDGSDEINVCIQKNRNIFCAQNIKDLSETPEGFLQGLFIRQYLRYLEKRASSQEAFGIGTSMESPEFATALRRLDANSLVPFFKLLLKQLCVLLDVEYKEIIIDNFCTLEAYQKLFDDGKILYQLLSNRIIFILDGFDDFPLTHKKLWLDIYRQFNVVVEELRLYFDSVLDSSKVFVQPPPRLKPLPFSMLERLEDEVRLSSIPKENVTEALESLGIKREEVDETVPPSQDPEVGEQLPENKSPLPSTTETHKKNEANPFMDDLFVVAPATTGDPAGSSALVDSVQKEEQSLLFSPHEATDAGAHFSVGIPNMQETVFDGGWSSGAPVSCEIVFPAEEHHLSTSGAAVSSHNVYCESPFISTEQGVLKQNDEHIFNELYTEGQNELLKKKT